ncbi:hypothetical protein Tco_1576534 [Tanacetum coccineum]
MSSHISIPFDFKTESVGPSALCVIHSESEAPHAPLPAPFAPITASLEYTQESEPSVTEPIEEDPPQTIVPPLS